MTTVTIAKIGSHPTVSYACEELRRCLKAMDRRIPIDERGYGAYDESVRNVIFVGLTPTVAESELDDEIYIDVKRGEGVISGANERAVLIAVYRFLRELGCRWIRPGDDGEIIPKRALDKSALTVSVRETPSTRYRCVAIEGASMFEHIRNIIEWIPRVGMNAYYTQKLAPMSFLNLWYSHRYNPFAEAEHYEYAFAEATNERMEEEIAKRSLCRFAVGHGWTAFPYGLKYDAITDINSPLLTEEHKAAFAEVNGVRGLFQNKLNFTQLCYSRPEVRRKMVGFTVNFCRDNPTINVIRYILADGMNNFCECEECKKMRPADWYMVLLNELDEALTEAGLDTKISFVIYVDLLWPPTQIKLKNPERFLMNLSPSSRTYSRPLSEHKVDPDTVELPPYEQNKLVMPRDVDTIIAFYNAWRRWIPECKCVTFDYHLMWDHYLDPGYTECARVLHADCTRLERLGFDGFISCQEQRCAYPTGLPMFAMAAALWDKNSRFEDVCADYYRAAFGDDGEAVSAYLAEISRLFDPAFMRNDHKEAHVDVMERMDGIDTLAESFLASHIEPHKDDNMSWTYLYSHATYCRMYAELVRCYAREDEAAIEAQTKAFTAYHFSLEPETHAVLDNFYFDEVYQRWIKRVFANKPTTVDF